MSIQTTNTQANSPIEEFAFKQRKFYVKRDDLIDPFLSGNKYRKLFSLITLDKSRIDTVISYGGVQSNAMVALAALCRQKNWHFIYYTKEVDTSHYLQISNYHIALRFGMQHKALDMSIYRDFIASLPLSIDERSYLVHQGGASRDALPGIRQLAHEIREAGLKDKRLATPSGTGTTALYLAKELPDFTVFTTPSIGDKMYLLKQMGALEKVPDNLEILESSKKYHFAKPYPEFYKLYRQLKECGVEFDLLYAPKLWKLLLEKTDGEILYIHSGGVTGNASMLARYAR